jgi:hypothetical protein
MMTVVDLIATVFSPFLWADAGAIQRLSNGKPDLNGVWQRPYIPDMSKSGPGQQGAGELPFTPEYAQKFKDYDPSKFDYTGRCLPPGAHTVDEFSVSDSHRADPRHYRDPL